jgi:hypothetical protein
VCFQERQARIFFRFCVEIPKRSANDDEASLPKAYCRIDVRVDGVLWGTVRSLLPDELAHALELSVHEIRPNADAIKAAVMRNEQVLGAEVRRGSQL